MELFDVEPFRLAYRLKPRGHAAARTRGIFVAIAVLIVLRLVVAAWLPLSFDEAYYWLWSKHLAASYYDHPPAIAYAIRLGTIFFGNTPFGVRVVPLLLSVAASWAVWQAGATQLESATGGALSCLFFNLTLMTTAETMTATPDAPLMTAAAFFVWALVNLKASGDARWWLAAGTAGGLALLSKYTALFLGLSAFAWLGVTREGRRWLNTPWPWLGATLAVALFVPVLWWNASHDWLSFRFQFAKAGDGHFAPHYLFEFLGGQIALASPCIFALGVIGLLDRRQKNSTLLSTLVWPSVLFFVAHTLHARVQGNWPSFLYPVLAIAAAGAAIQPHRAIWADRIAHVSRRWAAPVAASFLAVAYGQALFGILPMRDPTAHLLASGFAPMAGDIDMLREKTHAAGILTTNYAPTGWLAFYLPHHPPVIQINENYRWLAAPRTGADLLTRPLLYVTEPRRDEAAHVARYFSNLRLLATLARARGGRTISRYRIYLVSGWRGNTIGRITNAP